ncbi:MAG TPA: diguanylate cyclase [Tissierellaceae bacterium]
MNSVKRRYILFGIILTVIVTVGLIFEYIHLNEIITSEKKESIDRSLEYLRYQINSNLKLHSQYAVAAAEYISLGNWTEDGVKEYFEKIMENDPYIKSVYFKDKDNRLIATDSANSPKSYEWVEENFNTMDIENDRLFYSDIIQDSLENEPIIAIAKPVYDRNSEFIGAVVCDISLEKIIDIVEETDTDDLGYSFLIDSTGNIFAHPGYKDKSSKEIVNINSISENTHNELKKIKSGEIEVELNGVLGHLFFKPIENTDWVIGNFMSSNDLRKNEWNMIDLYATSLGVSLAIFVIFMYLQSKSIIQPIMKLDDDIRNINIEKNIEYRLPIDIMDPFIELRKSINLALDKAQEFFEQIEKDKEELMSQHKELIASYNELAENIEQRKILEEKLRDLSYRDQLTGLYNRRFFDEMIHKLDREENLPLAIIMADVNGLKLINDSFGHIIGDELLKSIARIIKKGIRESDIACRLSGDEFVIILPKTTLEDAKKIIDRLKDLSFGRRFLKDKGIDIEISVAYGIGVKDKPNMDILQVIKEAEDYMYSRKLFEGSKMRSRTIETIVDFLYKKSKREEEHSKRVAELCKQMAIALNLPEDKVEETYTAGLLHDIGKIAISDDALNNYEPYSNKGWEKIKKHPEIGYRILSTVNEMGQIAEYVLYHHERYDGLGHPKGLKGKEIPLVSRIIAIVDTYEMLSSDMPNKKAILEDEVIEKLLRNAGTHFDPELVEIFIEKVLNIKLMKLN